MRAIGLILAGGSSTRMKELTKNRATAALPIAGGYRSIDFVLSSMSSSRINKVGVITQYNSKSLTQHLNSSKWWDFGRKHSELFTVHFLNIAVHYISPCLFFIISIIASSISSFE